MSDDLERAVERLTEMADDLEVFEYLTPPRVQAAVDIRLILAANRKMREALERIADPRNIHFAGDAQVVARSALSTKED